MNCRKCGKPLNGQSKCPDCGTMLGYVVNDPAGPELGNHKNKSDGYVQSNGNTGGYVQNGFSFGGSGLGSWGISEPTNGAFNSNYRNDNNGNNNSLNMSGTFGHDNINSSTKEFSSIDTQSNEDEDYDSNIDNEVISVAGMLSRDMANTQTNVGNSTDNNVNANSEGNGFTMNLPENSNKTIIWIVAFVVILVVIILGVYVLPKVSDYGSGRYEQENFVITYDNNWTTEIDKNTSKVHFVYSKTDYKVIINAVSTFEKLNFKINNSNDKKTLYNAFYESWENVDGGYLTGGTGTFYDLEEDGSMYAKIDYTLYNDQGIGSFYVIVCEKYDIVISLMTYCRKEDKEEFEDATMKLINGIDYVGMTVLEKEQEGYLNFNSGSTKTYKAGTYIDYVIPDSWVLDEQRTAAIQSKYNIFKFKDGASLLEIKAYAGSYNYDGMKNATISSYGAIKEEKTMTINGKVWYVIVTPDYMSGGNSYHSEIYFTMSNSNKYLYYMQAYVYNEMSNDYVKKSYYDSSISYILGNMTLNGVNE